MCLENTKTHTRRHEAEVTWARKKNLYNRQHSILLLRLIANQQVDITSSCVDLLAISAGSICPSIVVRSFRRRLRCRCVIFRVPPVHRIDHFRIIASLFFHRQTLIFSLRKTIPFSVQKVIIQVRNWQPIYQARKRVISKISLTCSLGTQWVNVLLRTGL